jgi:hypothetical protein
MDVCCTDDDAPIHPDWWPIGPQGQALPAA